MSRRTELAFAVLAGAIFAVGLGLSGMTSPTKVIAFLDVAGKWDPGLAVVMASALVVHAAATRTLLRRGRPLVSPVFHLPTRKDVDAPLVVGAALFGVGWGIGGYCPGPAIVGMAAGGHQAAVFVVAMTAGMLARRLVPERAPFAALPPAGKKETS